jgi:hypothetical protein
MAPRNPIPSAAELSGATEGSYVPTAALSSNVSAPANKEYRLKPGFISFVQAEVIGSDGKSLGRLPQPLIDALDFILEHPFDGVKTDLGFTFAKLEKIIGAAKTAAIDAQGTVVGQGANRALHLIAAYATLARGEFYR